MCVIFPKYGYVTTREVACMPIQIVLYKKAVKRYSRVILVPFYFYLKLLSPLKTIAGKLYFFKMQNIKCLKILNFLLCVQTKYGGGIQQIKTNFL